MWDRAAWGAGNGECPEISTQGPKFIAKQPNPGPQLGQEQELVPCGLVVTRLQCCS